MAEPCDATNIPCRLAAVETELAQVTHPPMEITFGGAPYFDKETQRATIPLPPQYVEESWDVQVLEQDENLFDADGGLWMSNAPFDLDISAGVRVSVWTVGTDTAFLQIFVNSAPLFLAPQQLTMLQTGAQAGSMLIPFGQIDPSLVLIPAGARCEVNTSGTFNADDGWYGLDVSVIHRKKLDGVTSITPADRFPDFALWPLHYHREPLRDTNGTTPLNGTWGSGACFWPERGTILIIDNAGALGEFTVEGVCIRRCLLSGFGDVEGVCVWDGDDGASKAQLAICAEDQKIYQIEVPLAAAWTTVVMGGAGWIATIDASGVMPASSNLGLEAIEYDPVQDAFLVCNQAVGTDGQWDMYAFPRLSPTTPYIVFAVDRALPLSTYIDDIALTPQRTIVFIGHDSTIEFSSISEVTYGTGLPAAGPGRLIQMSTLPELRQAEGLAINTTGSRLWAIGEKGTATNSQLYVYAHP